MDAQGKHLDPEAAAMAWAEGTGNRLDAKRRPAAPRETPQGTAPGQGNRKRQAGPTSPFPDATRTHTAEASKKGPVGRESGEKGLVLIRDSREQRPYGFTRYGAAVLTAALPAGDYSLPGFEAQVAVERKELGDLIGCLMGPDRDRFERELARLRSYECRAVVVEASMQDVAQGLYRSEMKPHAALQSVIAFQVRYGVPFVWAGSREGAEYVTFWTLAKFHREIEERFRQARRGQARETSTQETPNAGQGGEGHA